METRSECVNPELTSALGIVEDAWQELSRGFFVQQQLGGTPVKLPDLSFAEAERRSAAGKSLLRRLDSTDSSRLPHDLALTLKLARFRAQTWSREAEWYWTVTDPLGIGYFGLFLPTAYCGGFLLSIVNSQFSSFSFSDSAAADDYLALVADYASLINQFAARTMGQAERGVRMPKVQVTQARSLLAKLKASVRHVVQVEPSRIVNLDSGTLLSEIERCVVGHIEPAFDRAIGVLSNDYLARCPHDVGIGQFPAGDDVYDELVRFHTTLNLSPEQVHAYGTERMDGLEQQMRAVQGHAGFEGDAPGFLASLSRDSSWRADTIGAISARFERYIHRLERCFGEYFSGAPQAPYGVAPLPEALQASMTYGYYDAPRKASPAGTYRYNAHNLSRQPLFSLAALTYHELVPGHHLHIASQLENQALHPFRRYSFLNAYNEGWAEYAATLAGEIGLYEEPAEQYGRLMMDAFLTSRLVVDTGMNALGWSLERARDYLRQHSGLPESEVATESIRYSCDIPGQSLAYKLGDAHIIRLRERMRSALGPHFDLKHFHASILGPGALPMPDLEWHIEREIERLEQPMPRSQT